MENTVDMAAVLSPVEGRGALLGCSGPIYSYEEAGDLMCSQAQQQQAANQCSCSQGTAPGHARPGEMETQQEWVLGCHLRKCSLPSGLGEDCGGHWDEGAGEKNVFFCHH